MVENKYGSAGMCPYCVHGPYCEKAMIGIAASKQSCSLNDPIGYSVGFPGKPSRVFYPKKRYEFKEIGGKND